MFIWSPVEFSPPIKFIGSAVAIEVIIAASAPDVKGTHRIGGNRKRCKQSTNADQKSLEKVFFDFHLSPACRATNANRKLCF